MLQPADCGVMWWSTAGRCGQAPQRRPLPNVAPDLGRRVRRPLRVLELQEQCRLSVKPACTHNVACYDPISWQRGLAPRGLTPAPPPPAAAGGREAGWAGGASLPLAPPQAACGSDAGPRIAGTEAPCGGRRALSLPSAEACCGACQTQMLGLHLLAPQSLCFPRVCVPCTSLSQIRSLLLHSLALTSSSPSVAVLSRPCHPPCTHPAHQQQASHHP